MNCFKTLLLTTFLISFAAVYATERDNEELQKIAIEKFISIKKNSTTRASLPVVPKLKQVDKNNVYTIFTAAQFGSVIVSNDDRVRPVLGYTDDEITEISTLPTNMQWWLNTITTILTDDGGIENDENNGEATDDVFPVIAPFVKTKWTQTTSPYNDMTPVVNGKHTPVGCMALAMAQIFNYCQYPESAKFTGACTITTKEETTSDILPINSTYQYPYLVAYGSYHPDANSTSKIESTEEENLAIATFLRDCGYAVRMNYAPSGSGSYDHDVFDAIINKFHYPAEAIKVLPRNLYSKTEWLNMISEELSKAYPVLYTGATDQNSGHAFIVHGMDSNGLAAVNWGWGGSYDGYYVVDLMDSPQGTFNTQQAMIIGFHKEKLESDSITSLWGIEDFSVIETGNEIAPLKLSVSAMFNYSMNMFYGQVTIFFEDEDTGEIVKKISIKDYSEEGCETYYGFNHESTQGKLSLQQIKTGHTYRVYIGSKDANENSYQIVRSHGGMFYFPITRDEEGNIKVGSKTAFGTKSSDSTGIEKIQTQRTNNELVNIYGQKVNDSYRGIVISNGKKLIRK